MKASRTLKPVLSREMFLLSLNGFGSIYTTRGAAFSPNELVEKVCGVPLTPEPFLDYLECKYSDLYAL
jgi:hypothetical protein